MLQKFYNKRAFFFVARTREAFLLARLPIGIQYKLWHFQKCAAVSVAHEI